MRVRAVVKPITHIIYYPPRFALGPLVNKIDRACYSKAIWRKVYMYFVRVVDSS